MEMLRDKIKGLERKIIEMIRARPGERGHRRPAAPLDARADAHRQPGRPARGAGARAEAPVPDAAGRACASGARPIAFAALPFAQGASATTCARFAASLHAPYCGVNSGFEAVRLARGARDRGVAGDDSAAPRRRRGGGAFGLLVLGSPDPTRYTADMGTEFLARIGEMASAGADAAAAGVLSERVHAHGRRDVAPTTTQRYLSTWRSSGASRRARWRCTAALDAAARVGRAPTACTLREAQPHHVRRWAAQLHARRLAPRSIALELSAWRGLYRWLGPRRRGRRTTRSTACVRRRRRSRCPRRLSVDQAVALAEQRRATEPAETTTRALAARDHCIDRAAVRLRPARRRTGRPRRARVSAGARLDRRSPIAARTCSARAASGAACRSARRRCSALAALARAARRALARADEAALFVSQRGTRLTASQVRARLRQLRAARRPAHARAPAHAAPHASPRTCCSRAATCAPCRSCSATPTSRPRRSTPSSTSSTWPRCTTPRIRAPKRR